MPKWIDMFDGRLEVAPPLTEDQLLQIPAKRGVVLLLAENRQPIVLLTAADIRSRTNNRLRNPDPEERRKTPDLRNITREILWKLAPGHFQAEWNFLELAGAIWPQECSQLVAWKPAWFVHVDAAGACPRFVRTRDVLAEAGEYLGPFEDGRSADRFIAALEDAFNLCRDVRCLRKAPHGPPCAYSQMNRCLGVGDGRISMDEYRAVISRAARFAAGARQEHRDELTAQMKAAAGTLQFERAAAIKSRLEKLAEFDKPSYRHVAPAGEFRFVVVQPGSNFRRARVFLVNRGQIVEGDDLDYPLKSEQVAKALQQMKRHVEKARPFADLDRWRMGLVSHFLYSSDERRGVMLRWRENTTAEELTAAVESAAGTLGLRAPAVRKKKEKPPTPEAGTPPESEQANPASDSRI